jgi:hypothetical protein
VVAIDLGPLEATEGMQGFPIPADTASTVSSLIVAVVAAMDGDGVAPPACEHPATTIATTRWRAQLPRGDSTDALCGKWSSNR